MTKLSRPCAFLLFYFGHNFIDRTYTLFKEVDKMKNDQKKQQVLKILAKNIRLLIEREKLDFDKVQEIHLRIGRELYVVYENKEKFFKEHGKNHIVTKEEVRETIEYISQYSIYAYEQQISHGFITVEGGHRAGVSGKVIQSAGRIKTIQYISSINIRVAHEIKGCADKVFPYVIQNGAFLHTLVISPPGCGKTTLIRDMIRQISDGNKYLKGNTVGVADERSELGACYQGKPQNDLGLRTDILDCCPKAEGVLLLIRSMSPKVIAVDEIGTEDDLKSLGYALTCGCRLLASVHGKDLEEVRRKPLFEQIMKEQYFDRYIVLSGEVNPGMIHEIYDKRGNVLCRNL